MNADDWDARYAESATVWSREPNAWVAETVEPLLPGTAVDLAAGEGRHALWLATLGWQVTAVDFSRAGLVTGQARAREVGVDIHWVVADATVWVSPCPVDLVVMAYLQLPAAGLSAAIRGASGYLAPGGTLAVIGHDRENLERGIGGPRDPAVHYTVEELRRAASDLEIVRCEQVERKLPGGVAIDTVLVARAG